MRILLNGNELRLLIKEKNIEGIIDFFSNYLPPKSFNSNIIWEFIHSSNFEIRFGLFTIIITVPNSKIPTSLQEIVFTEMRNNIHECHQRMKKLDLISDEILNDLFFHKGILGRALATELDKIIGKE